MTLTIDKLAAQAEAKIAQVEALETRLIACEKALLLGCHVNHPEIQAYFATYPEPYIP